MHSFNRTLFTILKIIDLDTTLRGIDTFLTPVLRLKICLLLVMSEVIRQNAPI